MKKYMLRRVAASIPVLLLASILIFLLVREFGADPARVRCQASRDVHCRERVEGAARPRTRRCPMQYVDVHGRLRPRRLGSRASGPTSPSPSRSAATSGRRRSSRSGPCSSPAGSRSRVGVYSASRPYSRGDYLFTGLAFAGIAMPTFWFGLLTIQYLTLRAPTDPRHDRADLLLDPEPGGLGCRSTTSAGSRSRCSCSRCSSSPAGAGTSGRRCSRSSTATTSAPRARRGSPAAHGRLEARAAELVERARDGRGDRRRRAVRRAHHHRADLLSARHGHAAARRAVNNGDTQIVLPWMLVVGAFIIVFNLIADVVYGVLDPRVQAAMSDHRSEYEQRLRQSGTGTASPAGTSALLDAAVVTAEESFDHPEFDDEGVSTAPPVGSSWRLVGRRFLRHKVAVALVAHPAVHRHARGLRRRRLPVRLQPAARRSEVLADARQPPSWEHLFGTDKLGRDQFTRVLYALQKSLVIGLGVAFLSVVIGVRDRLDGRVLRRLDRPGR